MVATRSAISLELPMRFVRLSTGYLLVLLLLNGCSGSIENPKGLPLRLTVEKVNSPLVSNNIPFRDPATKELLVLEVVFGKDSKEYFLQINRMPDWVPLRRFNLLLKATGENNHSSYGFSTNEIYQRSDDSLFSFYYVKDSIYVNLFMINLNTGQRELLFTRTRSDSNDIQSAWDGSISGPYFRGNTSSDTALIWVRLYTGLHSDPRSTQVLDRIWPYTVRFSLINGAPLNTITLLDIDQDQENEILLSTRAPCNGHDEGLMDDLRCWYAAYSFEGNNLWATPLRLGGGSAIIRVSSNPGRHLMGIHRLSALNKEARISYLHELSPLTGEIIREQEVSGYANWCDFVQEDTSRMTVIVNTKRETVQYYTFYFQPFGKEKQIENVSSYQGLLYPWGIDNDPVLQFRLKDGRSIVTDLEFNILALYDGVITNQKVWEKQFLEYPEEDHIYSLENNVNSKIGIKLVKFNHTPFLEWFTARYKWPLISAFILLVALPGFYSFLRFLGQRIILKERIRNEKIILKQKEHLETIFDGVKNSMVTIKPDLTISHYNQAFTNLFGFNRSSEIIGKNLTELLPANMDAINLVVRNTLEKKRSIKQYQVEIEFPPNKNKVLMIDSTHIESSDESMEVLLYIKDITKLYNLELVVQEQDRFRDLIGKSPVMQNLYRQIIKVAKSDTTILITGETGTGKELVSTSIHQLSKRNKGPFLRVNCSALNDQTLQSELFGHEPGAFTGARRTRIGRFEAANNGTILLDEIGDISAKMQMSLLRILQEREFERMGSNKTLKTNARIIAATNSDLREKIRNGEFRDDLYYRLNVIHLEVPPLRKRREDIPLLVNFFLTNICRQQKRSLLTVSLEVMELLQDNSWPGNIRQLRSCIESACLNVEGDILTLASLPKDLINTNSSWADSVSLPESTDHAVRYRTDKISIDVLIERTLRNTHGNISKTAAILNKSRQTLYNWLNKQNKTADDFR